jgi:sugar phosphate isomerase/epimerase
MTTSSPLPPQDASREAPPPPALSTMWAMQPRFEHDLGAFMARAEELGYRAVEINHSMTAEQVGAILGFGTLPVTGVHAPAPLERDPSAGWNRELNLAAIDETERALAVQYHRRSIDLAVEASAHSVIVHLGNVGANLLAGEQRLRSMYARREQLRDEWQRIVDETVKERAGIATPWLAQARRSLDALAESAAARGVTLAFECRLHYHEIPLPAELAVLLAPYPAMSPSATEDPSHLDAPPSHVSGRRWRVMARRSVQRLCQPPSRKTARSAVTSSSLRVSGWSVFSRTIPPPQPVRHIGSPGHCGRRI